MLAGLANFEPAPACVVVGNAFTSLREEGAHSGNLRGPLRLLLYIMPDDWNNVQNVARNHVPLLVVHSDADPVIPVEMGRRVFAAAPPPKQMVVLHGLKHNALYRSPEQGWWMAVLLFVQGEALRRD